MFPDIKFKRIKKNPMISVDNLLQHKIKIKS